MFRVVSATLPAGVPGLIGLDDGMVVIVLDGVQMDAMPWNQRIAICNSLLSAPEMGVPETSTPPAPVAEIIDVTALRHTA